MNAAVNPLTALTARPNGALLEEPGLERLAERAALEAARVGGRLGHVEPAWNPLPALRALLEETRANYSSMAQDLARGRRTEIEAIAGAIVQAAEPFEEPVPVLRALLSLVQAAEAPEPSQRPPL
jgi:2-dehydropantoate 2-reductase